MSNQDIMATLCELTVQSIILSLNLLPTYPKKIILMGGGVNNKNLVNKIKSYLDKSVKTANEINMPHEMIEAELIAYLSARSFYKLPITFPKTTGTKKPQLGGELFLA